MGGDGGGVVVVSAGNVCGTRGSGIVSSAADMLGLSVVRCTLSISAPSVYCLWLISQIHTCLCVVADFMRSSARYPAGPHDRLSQKR